MASYQNGSSAANGVEAVDGSKNGASKSSIDPAEKLASHAKPKPTPIELKPTKANRVGVANLFDRYSQVLQSEVQPLPNQGGAGTFSENKKWGKLRGDLKRLRFAGM
jgi:linoleate 10R-lipoxygenase